MKKKETINDKYYSFLFFIFIALILIFTIVTVQQIRMAKFDAKLDSIEDSVERIKSGVGGLVGTIERYERALDLPGEEELGEDFLVGDRIEEKLNEKK